MTKLIKLNSTYISLSNARSFVVLPEDVETFLEIANEEDQTRYEASDLGSELYVSYQDYQSTVAVFSLKENDLQARLDKFVASNETVLDLSEFFLDIHFSEDDCDDEDDCCGEDNCCSENNEEAHDHEHTDCCSDDNEDCCSSSNNDDHSHEHTHTRTN
ncbi:hypothetical protein OF377_00905 [Ureaplasma sp. ES3154-GEN]|uniref:hypothetical protein n=1 Tax=Ureaplasma sp. ES3154-GEN TaxID=2984844 RepID=UPI0021E8C27D|nr:hypothetical protein [Ureaplasma sp. ES3154-GEN]MCV3743447.1 hypothetical protein [Ureaplasma sp. ES3154-GEN]